MRRRKLLATMAVAGTSGCLRLTAEEDDAETTRSNGTERAWTTKGDERAAGGDGGDERRDTATTDDQRESDGSDFEGVDPEPAEGNWPMFAGNAANAGYTLDVGPKRNARQLWRFDARVEGQDTPVVSSPTVADGRVYVGAVERVFVLDAESGDQLGSKRVGANVGNALAVDDEAIYFGNGSQNEVVALERGSGERRWSVETNGEISYSSATLADGILLIGCKDTALYGIEADTGSLIGRYRAGSPIESTPAIAGQTAYVGTNGGDVHAVDVRDGSQKWRFETGGRVKTSPGVADGTVYVGSDQATVYALHADDGSERWSADIGRRVWASPAVARGVVYFATRRNQVYALDAESGREVWQTTIPGGVKSGVTVADGVVYLGCYDGNVYALSGETGEKLWQFETGDQVRTSPAVVDGTVYVGSDDGFVYAITGDT